MDERKLELFLDKIEIDEETGCWVWLANLSTGGYGKFNIGGYMYRAHRLSYEHYIGPIPDDMFVLHKCPFGSNKRCVNPDHLKLGDHQENMDDMVLEGKSQHRPGEIHPMAKLTDQDIEVIRHMWNNKHRFSVTQQSIAEMFGVTQHHISDIVRGNRRNR